MNYELSLWALLWQPGSNSVRVESLTSVLSNNRRRYMNDGSYEDSWLPLIVGTRAEVSEAAEAANSTVATRKKEGAAAGQGDQR